MKQIALTDSQNWTEVESWLNFVHPAVKNLLPTALVMATRSARRTMCTHNHRTDSSPYTQKTFATSLVNCMPAMFVKGVKNRLCRCVPPQHNYTAKVG